MKQLITILSLTALLGGCSAPITQRERSTLTGGALGAGAGALIGSAVGHPGRGALIGGALGALGGAAMGDQMEGQYQRQEAQSRELEEQRREIERQRREFEDIRRSRYEDDYNSRRYEREYDRNYDQRYPY
ncbi:MAG: glycine zipper domain-containing protein [Candidatus Binatia bacterium]